MCVAQMIEDVSTKDEAADTIIGWWAPIGGTQRVSGEMAREEREMRCPDSLG